MTDETLDSPVPDGGSIRDEGVVPGGDRLASVDPAPGDPAPTSSADRPAEPGPDGDPSLPTDPVEPERTSAGSEGSDPAAGNEPAPGATASNGRPEADASVLSGPLEALLLMATEPMSTAELAQALDAPAPAVWAALDDLRRFYDETHRGFELREVGRGWRYYTRAEHHDLIAQWVLEGQQGRLSQAALETLAVVAYLQPISRSRVSSIRGVNVDGVMRTLATRDLIEEADRDSETGAMLFRTTDYFLERLGLTALTDLPPIAPLLPEASALEAELAGLASVADLTNPDAEGAEGGGPEAASEAAPDGEEFTADPDPTGALDA